MSILPRCICDPLDAMVGKYDQRCTRHLGVQPLRCRCGLDLHKDCHPDCPHRRADCAPEFVDGKPVRQRIEPRGPWMCCVKCGGNYGEVPAGEETTK